jgi:hypothetical protein
MELFESNFDKFWAAWPKSYRKGGKSVCLTRWKKGLYDGCADQIIKHVEWMKTTDAWRKDQGAFIPAPLVYLNQQRWDGAEIPDNFVANKPVSQQIDPALQKIAADRAKAAPMPNHIRERLAQIRRM